MNAKDIKMFTVKDLRKSIWGLSDDMVVCIDTEARCFNAHLIEVHDVSRCDFYQRDDIPEILVITPVYDGTTHHREKGE